MTFKQIARCVSLICVGLLFEMNVARAADTDLFLQRQAFKLGEEYSLLLCASLKKGSADQTERNRAIQIVGKQIRNRAILLDVKIDDLSPISGQDNADAAFETGMSRASRLRVRLESRLGASAGAGFRLASILYFFTCDPPPTVEVGRVTYSRLQPDLAKVGVAKTLEGQVAAVFNNPQTGNWPERVMALISGIDTALVRRFAATATGSRLRANVWGVATCLGIAAISNARGDDQLATRMFETAKDLTVSMPSGIHAMDGFPPSLPELPRRSGVETTDLAAAMGYLFVEVGQPVGSVLDNYYGSSFSALLDLGVKAYVASLLYQPVPGDAETLTLISVIRRDGAEAALPSALYAPIAEAMEKRRPNSEVTKLIIQQVAAISSYLVSQAEGTDGQQKR